VLNTIRRSLNMASTCGLPWSLSFRILFLVYRMRTIRCRVRNSEAVASHTRATLSQRLTDVSSSDRHTVKPWLSSRLDYSPPVQDFAADGLPLVGGRLDYLGGQSIATLVYRYREHTIDVFVRPLSGGLAAPAPSLTTLRGFNVAHARGAGMEWWGVSDVSADVLTGLVARLAHGE